jgi:hypothetical protein
MDLNAILSKTAKGIEELETRKYRLEQRKRALLIVVNGKATTAELMKKFEAMGDISPMLEQLLADGYIAAGAGAPAAAAAPGAPAAAKDDYAQARAALVRAVVDVLGPGGDAIAEKMEECASRQDLKNYLDTRRAMLEVALGKKGAGFWAKAKELLG